MPIDILLGADLFFNFILPGRLSSGPQLSNLQRTSLGWVVAGSISPNSSASKALSSSRRTHCILSERVSNEQLDSQLKKFWELEDLSHSTVCQPVDPVGKHFANTTLRYCSGRFMVNLPKKPNHSLLGVYKALALKRLFPLKGG